MNADIWLNGELVERVLMAREKKGKGSKQGGGKTVTKAARIEDPVRGI